MTNVTKQELASILAMVNAIDNSTERLGKQEIEIVTRHAETISALLIRVANDSTEFRRIEQLGIQADTIADAVRLIEES